MRLVFVASISMIKHQIIFLILKLLNLADLTSILTSITDVILV